MSYKYKRQTTTSDRGGFLFGNENFTILVLNNYGDTDNMVFLFESEEDYTAYLKDQTFKRSDFKWLTVINGKFNLYNDDCCANEENVAFRMDGKYDLYLFSLGFNRPILAIVKR